ncbi:MAG TPA: hypothetical protein VEL74_20070 [Thermoanaerobaculia bacterium]|nr:hypothetical protein [Thermoanaerobaculia bacterium]
MRSFTDGSSPSNVSNGPNAFTASFLDRLAERDEGPTAPEADVAGPWRIEEIPGEGFGVFRLGESTARGFEPTLLCPSEWLALVAAGVLPGTGRDPMLLLQKDRNPDGTFSLILESGEVVGRSRLFDEKLVDSMNTAIHLLRAPESLANVLDAAGLSPLERCGAILDERAGQRAGRVERK